MNTDDVPRVVWWMALGVMPLLIAVGLLLAVILISSISANSDVPLRACLVGIAMYLIASAVRMVLSCVDWFEARQAKKAGHHG